MTNSLRLKLKSSVAALGITAVMLTGFGVTATAIDDNNKKDEKTVVKEHIITVDGAELEGKTIFKVMKAPGFKVFVNNSKDDKADITIDEDGNEVHNFKGKRIFTLKDSNHPGFIISTNNTTDIKKALEKIDERLSLLKKEGATDSSEYKALKMAREAVEKTKTGRHSFAFSTDMSDMLSDNMDELIEQTQESIESYEIEMKVLRKTLEKDLKKGMKAMEEALEDMQERLEKEDITGKISQSVQRALERAEHSKLRAYERAEEKLERKIEQLKARLKKMEERQKELEKAKKSKAETKTTKSPSENSTSV